MTVPLWIELSALLLAASVVAIPLAIWIKSKPAEQPVFTPGDLVQGPDRLFFDLGDPDGFGTAIVDSEDGRK